MAPLLGLLADGDGAVRQKGLMALSCLVRHSPPAVQKFHEVRCFDLQLLLTILLYPLTRLMLIPIGRVSHSTYASAGLGCQARPAA